MPAPAYAPTEVYDAASFEAIDSIEKVHPSILEAVKFCPEAIDASETMVFARQLQTVKNRVYEIQYPALKGRSLLPFSNEADPDSETLVYRVWDRVTAATIITDYSTDFPTVAASAKEYILRFHDYGNSYGYTIPELRRAQKLGVGLDMKMAEYAREGMELAVDRACAIGEPAIRTYGLLNHPNVDLVTLPNGTWSSATGEDMLADLNHLVTTVSTDSDEIESVTDIVMSVAAYRLITTTILNTAGSSMTVLQAFLAQNPGVQVTSWVKAKLANAAGTNGRIVAYSKRPEVLEFEMALEFEVFGPQQQAMRLDFFTRGRWAGVTVHRPKAIKYADNQLL